MAVKLVIEPIFEADFCDCSYGYRPKKSAHDAVNDIAYALNCRYTDVIDADVTKYFDTIPHAKLMAVVAERIADGAILHLIKMWLKAPVVGEGEDGTRRNIGGGKANTKGTPQGGVISPLLANLYLHLLDRLWERRHLQKRFEARLVRYADDIVVLCRKGTKTPLAEIQRVCDRLGLCLNEHKTRMVNAKQESFDFLGFEFRMRTSLSTGNLYPHVQPTKKSLKKIKAQVTMLTDRRLTMLPLPVVMQRVNEALRGWVGYFHYRNSSGILEQLKRHAEQRVRIHLSKRYKVRGKWLGYIKFPNRLLYQRYGLYKVPTTAGWKTAHAVR
jgi:group II intron reverse transcriptase/maturase